MGNIDKTVGSFRSAIQDLLVPELKAIQAELRHHSDRIDKLEKRLEKNQEETNKRFEAMDKRFEAVLERIHGVEKTQERVLEKLDSLGEILEMNKRLAAFEGRFSQLEKIVLTGKIGVKEIVVS